MERRVVATYLNLTQELGEEFSVKTRQFRWKRRNFYAAPSVHRQAGGNRPRPFELPL